MSPANIREAADLPTNEILEPVLVGQDLIGGCGRSDFGETDVVLGMASDLEASPQLRDIGGAHNGPTLRIAARDVKRAAHAVLVEQVGNPKVCWVAIIPRRRDE